MSFFACHSTYTKANGEEAEIDRGIMAEKWDKIYPVVSKSWKSNFQGYRLRLAKYH